MAVLLLIVIYIVFISLGLPDGVLGSAWPAIYPSLHVPAGLGGVVGLLVTSMTIVSSLSTAWLVRRLGIGLLLALSTGLTAAALIGFSQSQHIVWLMLLALPLGFGAGAIDAALNNYVATHYKAHHMNWLHAFWGLGATIGPLLFAASLARSGDWHAGFLVLGLVQAAIVILLFVSLPLWKKVHALRNADAEPLPSLEDVKFRVLLRDRPVQLAFLSFLLYVGVEVSVSLWLASYLVNVQGLAVGTAATFGGLYFAAITVGRVLAGFISMKVGSVKLLRAGILLSLVGMVLVALNISGPMTVVGVVLIGVGFAPVFPGMIHETPVRFGRARSDKVMSLQMVGGYVGATTIPPLIGLLSGVFSFNIFVMVGIAIITGLLVVTELMNRMYRRVAR